MAKCIYICSKNKLPLTTKDKILEICKALEPDNVEVESPHAIVDSNIAIGIMNPNDQIISKNLSLLTGKIINYGDYWDEINNYSPDGSFAIFRNSPEYCELMTDNVASRTIWYYHDPNYFIGSTSQRAIIMFLQSFELNFDVFPWILSTGTLGPEFSWDNRLKRIRPNSSVLLNKNTWMLDLQKRVTDFNPKKNSRETHKYNLFKAIDSTIQKLDLDYSKWYLPLSGGFDSRGILLFLINNSKQSSKLNTITWGTSDALSDTQSDAFIAQKLASNFEVKHTYFNTDLPSEPIEVIFERFLRNGEGRVDHISGYMDGFKIWKSLYEAGVKGIIRGDESFGWNRVYTELDVRLSCGLALCSDIENLKLYHKFGFLDQEMPENLEKKRNESIATWRDRIYMEYRVPTIIAALTDLKLTYVEQVSPLLARPILNYVKLMPDKLRTEKNLFKEIVNDFDLKIDYATRNSIASPTDILYNKKTLEFIKKELSSEYAKTIIPEEFLKYILGNIKFQKNKNKKNFNRRFQLQSYLIKILPRPVKSVFRQYFKKPTLNFNLIAFRLFIILKMNNILTKDSSMN